MEYVEFKGAFLQSLLNYLEQDDNNWQVLIQKMRRVNENEIDAFSIARKNQHSHVKISRVFYLPDVYEVYQRGESMDEILESILDLAKVTYEEFDLERGFLNAGKYKKWIEAELIGRERNSLLLEQIVYREFLDLAIIYRLKLRSRNGWTTSILITKEILKAWNMTPDELHLIAMQNTGERSHFAINNIADLLELDEDDKFPIYVMSNLRYEYGAIGIAFSEVLNRAVEIVGDHFIILPSSLHEVLLLPWVPGKDQILHKLVETVNREVIPAELQLSDSIYQYDRETECIEIVQ